MNILKYAVMSVASLLYFLGVRDPSSLALEASAVELATLYAQNTPTSAQYIPDSAHRDTAQVHSMHNEDTADVLKRKNEKKKGIESERERESKKEIKSKSQSKKEIKSESQSKKEIKSERESKKEIKSERESKDQSESQEEEEIIRRRKRRIKREYLFGKHYRVFYNTHPIIADTAYPVRLPSNILQSLSFTEKWSVFLILDSTPKEELDAFIALQKKYENTPADSSSARSTTDTLMQRVQNEKRSVAHILHELEKAHKLSKILEESDVLEKKGTLEEGSVLEKNLLEIIQSTAGIAQGINLKRVVEVENTLAQIKQTDFLEDLRRHISSSSLSDRQKAHRDGAHLQHNILSMYASLREVEEHLVPYIEKLGNITSQKKEEWTVETNASLEEKIRCFVSLDIASDLERNQGKTLLAYILSDLYREASIYYVEQIQMHNKALTSHLHAIMQETKEMQASADLRDLLYFSRRAVKAITEYLLVEEVRLNEVNKYVLYVEKLFNSMDSQGHPTRYVSSEGFYSDLHRHSSVPKPQIQEEKCKHPPSTQHRYLPSDQSRNSSSSQSRNSSPDQSRDPSRVQENLPSRQDRISHTNKAHQNNVQTLQKNLHTSYTPPQLPKRERKIGNSSVHSQSSFSSNIVSSRPTSPRHYIPSSHYIPSPHYIPSSHPTPPQHTPSTIMKESVWFTVQNILRRVENTSKDRFVFDQLLLLFKRLFFMIENVQSCSSAFPSQESSSEEPPFYFLPESYRALSASIAKDLEQDIKKKLEHTTEASQKKREKEKKIQTKEKEAEQKRKDLKEKEEEYNTKKQKHTKSALQNTTSHLQNKDASDLLSIDSLKKTKESFLLKKLSLSHELEETKAQISDVEKTNISLSSTPPTDLFKKYPNMQNTQKKLSLALTLQDSLQSKKEKTKHDLAEEEKKTEEKKKEIEQKIQKLSLYIESSPAIAKKLFRTVEALYYGYKVFTDPRISISEDITGYKIERSVKNDDVKNDDMNSVDNNDDVKNDGMNSVKNDDMNSVKNDNMSSVDNDDDITKKTNVNKSSRDDRSADIHRVTFPISFYTNPPESTYSSSSHRLDYDIQEEYPDYYAKEEKDEFDTEDLSFSSYLHRLSSSSSLSFSSPSLPSSSPSLDSLPYFDLSLQIIPEFLSIVHTLLDVNLENISAVKKVFAESNKIDTDKKEEYKEITKKEKEAVSKYALCTDTLQNHTNTLHTTDILQNHIAAQCSKEVTEYKEKEVLPLLKEIHDLEETKKKQITEIQNTLEKNIPDLQQHKPAIEEILSHQNDTTYTPSLEFVHTLPEYKRGNNDDTNDGDTNDGNNDGSNDNGNNGASNDDTNDVRDEKKDYNNDTTTISDNDEKITQMPESNPVATLDNLGSLDSIKKQNETAITDTPSTTKSILLTEEPSTTTETTTTTTEPFTTTETTTTTTEPSITTETVNITTEPSSSTPIARTPISLDSIGFEDLLDFDNLNQKPAEERSAKKMQNHSTEEESILNK